MVFHQHWHYPCAAEIEVDYLCSLTALSSWNSFHTAFSYLLATSTDLLLSYRFRYSSSIGYWYLPHLVVTLISVGVSHSLVSAVFSVGLPRILHSYKSTPVSTTVSFISLHSCYPHQYHCYSYTSNYLVISTHSFIPCGTRLPSAIHQFNSYSGLFILHICSPIGLSHL
jgi:hypothetical protein